MDREDLEPGGDVVTSREFASWPDAETSLATCRQNARILQGKYQDKAAALDQAHRALARIAERHADDGHRACSMCGLNWPCPDNRDATGATS